MSRGTEGTKLAHLTCGLELSDLVLSIDGIPMTNRDAMKRKRDALLRADSFVIELERRGQLESLTYRVR
jgi:hypothetical protein